MYFYLFEVFPPGRKSIVSEVDGLTPKEIWQHVDVLKNPSAQRIFP